MEIDAKGIDIVILERLKAHSEGISWIEEDLAGKIRNRMVGAMFRQKSVIEVIETRIGKPSDLRSQIDIRRIDRLFRFHAAIFRNLLENISLVHVLKTREN